MIRIEVTKAGNQWTYAAEGMSATHKTDGLCALCRDLVEAGFSGPAMSYRDGTPSVVVKDIARMATRTLQENDKGLRFAKFVPFDRTMLAAASERRVG
jgi:hypothetical protein